MATVRTLLNRALYLSLSDRESFDVQESGSYINAALDIFVEQLDIDRSYVPFWKTQEIIWGGETTALGVAYLTLSDNASAINFVQARLNNTIYTLRYGQQADFYLERVVTTLITIPETYFHDKSSDRIEIYPTPSPNVNAFYVGYIPKMVATNLDQELPTSIPTFLAAYFSYAVAERLCQEYKCVWSDGHERQRLKLELKAQENSNKMPNRPRKPLLKGDQSNVPWLAYILGNGPGSN